MKLYFDENCGKGVPRALRSVGPSAGIFVEYAGRTKKGRRGQLLGASDEQWITFVGKGGFLGISRNSKILDNDEERDVIYRQNAGIVFLTCGNDRAVDVLMLLLKELDWLREIHEKVKRPFAFTLNMSRRKRQVLGEVVDFEEWQKKIKK